MYRSRFKDLKRKCPPPDYSDVVDFNNLDGFSDEVVCRNDLINTDAVIEDCHLQRLINPVKEWKIYELKNKPGLLFINNPFTWIGQRYWACRCLQDFPQKPNHLNLDAHNELKPGEDWWVSSQQKDGRSVALRKKLRWATMGYHHNWNTKVYTESARDPFPPDLAALSRFVGDAVGFTEPFEAQAAIVNYYHLDSTLSGHTDHSEEHATAPLFSFSFGQTAIFLLGGQSIDDIPTPMYIRSGDIVVMSGYSRLCYHGVPKIMKTTCTPWEPVGDIFKNDESGTGIQVSGEENSFIRTKNESGCDGVDTKSLEDESAMSPKSKKRKTNSRVDIEKIDCSNLDHLKNDELWRPFKLYVGLSRININVRQVLYAGQKVLTPNSQAESASNVTVIT